MALSTGQSWLVLKFWLTAVDPEKGVQHCFADELNQSLVFSVEALITFAAVKSISLKVACKDALTV